MPNPKLETYKNKATGTVYDFTDADAQSKVTATVDLLKDTTGWLGGNECVNNAVSKAENGVTWTVNADKSISAYGQPIEGDAYIDVNSGANVSANGVAWICKGCPSDGGNDKYYSQIRLGNPDGTWHGARTDTGNGYQLTTAEVTANVKIQYRCVIPSGAPAIPQSSPIVFRPMIISPEQYALNPSYRPYHGSVEAELAKKASTADVAAIAEVIPSSATSSNKVATAADVTATVDLLKDTTGWTGKNLLRLPYSEGTNTRNGITWTVNSDGTITANGTSTADEVFSVYDGNTLPRDIPLTVVGGVSNNLYLYVNGRKNGQWVKTYVEQRGEPKEFTILSTDDVDEIYVRLRINANQTVNNLVFYLMICRSDEYAFAPTYEPYHESVEEMFATKDVTVTAGTDVTVNANTHVYSKAGVVTGSLRLEIGATLSAGATIATLSAIPKNTTYAIGIDNTDKSVIPIIIGNNGAVQLFGGFIPTSGNQLLIPIAYATA